MVNSENSCTNDSLIIDASDLVCPMPLLKMKQALNKAEVGETIIIKVSDPASERDFKSFIQTTNHRLKVEINAGQFLYYVTKEIKG